MSALRHASVASQVALLALAQGREGAPGPLARLLRSPEGFGSGLGADSDSDSGADAAGGSALALQVLAVAALLALSGLFAGLGLGLMSLDLIGLEIVVAAGQDELASARERRISAAARRIIPIRRQGNLLLTTLLMGNVAVNALTSILMADLTSGGWARLLLLPLTHRLTAPCSHPQAPSASSSRPRSSCSSARSSPRRSAPSTPSVRHAAPTCDAPAAVLTLSFCSRSHRQ